MSKLNKPQGNAAGVLGPIEKQSLVSQLQPPPAKYAEAPVEASLEDEIKQIQAKPPEQRTPEEKAKLKEWLKLGIKGTQWSDQEVDDAWEAAQPVPVY